MAAEKHPTSDTRRRTLNLELRTLKSRVRLPQATPSGGGQLPARPPLRTVLESFPSFRLKPFTTGAPGVGTRRQSGHETNNRERIAGSDAAVSERARQSTGAARSIWCIAGRRAGPAL